MKKSHGPDLRKVVIPLAQCPTCRGKALLQGVFYDVGCQGCNASGWVRASDGQALELEELATQLGFRLRAMMRELEWLRSRAAGGDENNQRGAGRSHFTGD